MIVLLALLALIAPIVVVEPLQDDVVLPKLATTAAFTGVALLLLAVELLRGRSAGRWPPALWLAVVAFAAVNVLAYAFAVDKRFSLWGEHQRYQGLATTLLYLLLFGVASFAVRSTRELRLLLFAVFAGALGVAIYALIQKAGLDWVDWQGQALNRPAATLGQANAFGAYLVAATSACAFLALTARDRARQAAIGLGLAVMLCALLFTLSRSAYIATFIVLIVWSVAAVLWFAFYRLGKRPERSQFVLVVASGAGAALVVVAIGAVAFAQLGAGQEVLDRFRTSGQLQNQSVGGRLSLWRLALDMTADRPLLGHGHDAFAVLFPRYRDRPDLPGIGEASLEAESSHNFFLDLAAGTGVLGLLAFLALTGAVLWYAAARALAGDSLERRIALVALGAAVLGYLVATFFGFSEAMTTWLFWLLLGALAGLLVHAPEAPARPAPPRLAVAPFALAAVAAGVAALVWASTMVAADLAAGQSARAATRGDAAQALRLAHRAASLNPFERLYLSQEAGLYAGAPSPSGDPAENLERAIATYELALSRFEPDADDMLGLAIATYELDRARGRPIDDAVALFEAALALDPYDYLSRNFVAELYEREGLTEQANAQRIIIYCWRVPCD